MSSHIVPPSTKTRAVVAVRELAAHDLAAYKALRDEALARHDDAFTSDAASEATRTLDSYRARLGGGDDGSFTLGAFEGDALVGALTIERDARAKVRHLGHLVGMIVDVRCQGRGIGRTLLEAAIDRARHDDELHQLTLTVTSTNAVAVRLYEQAGFIRYGRLPRAILTGGRFLDKDLMLLELR
jgi:ribosomal protein S18 acetylase RimI-like enzyme